MTVHNLLPSLFAPVLIGCDRRVRRIGRRLFWQYGMLSHVFAEHFPLLCLLSPWMICHPLPRGASSSLYEMALTDFAAEQQELDRTPLLFLTQDKHTPTFSDEQKRTLESSYLLCPDADETIFSRLIAYQGGD